MKGFFYHISSQPINGPRLIQTVLFQGFSIHVAKVLISIIICRFHISKIWRTSKHIAFLKLAFFVLYTYTSAKTFGIQKNEFLVTNAS